MSIQVGQAQWVRPILGHPQAPIVVLCDPQSGDAFFHRKPIGAKALKTFFGHSREAGLEDGLFQFVALCPPIPDELSGSAKKSWDFVVEHAADLAEVIDKRTPRMVVALGNHALRWTMGKSLAITKNRGIAIEKNGRLVFPMLAPSHVNRLPEMAPVFGTDFVTLKRIIAAGFDRKAISSGTSTSYEWCWDLAELIAKKPKALAIDTETTGLRWYMPGTRVITVQLTPEVGRTLICPIHPEYRRRWFNDTSGLRGTAKLRGQLRQLLADPDIPKVAHNLKYDNHLCRIERLPVENWGHDTMQLAFAADENMMSKSLDDCVKRWVPDMAGYADQFNAMVDKGRMMDVPPEDVFDLDGALIQPGMRNYAGPDPDAVFRLAKVLVPLVKKDLGQWNCYRRVMMPGVLAFGNVIEVYGERVDLDYLRAFETEIRDYLAKEYDRLIRMVPAAVRRKHIEAGQECSFTRDAFMRDVLFSREGFKLKPRVFTASTANLPPDQRVPSVSTKDHLPYFEDVDGVAGDFVRGYKEWQKAAKLLSTYVGEEAKGSGFWKFMLVPPPNPGSNEPVYGEIHPSYRLDKTNTGRTSSQEPNGQNIPKRGDFAKSYRKAFKAAVGYKRVECDLSQIELRLVAWMAREPAMLKVYADGGDIHAETGMATSKITIETWLALEEELRELNRFKAKAVNFGFVYGMGWRGFKTYAKTQYGVDYTDAEALETRTLYFRKYARLPEWHEEMKAIAHRYGGVRALHGSLRRLPSIWSDDDSAVALAERQSVNAPIQRFGSDLGVIAASILTRHADPEILRPVGFIHDMLKVEAREGYEDQAAGAVKWIMENIPLKRYFGITPPIPILSDPEVENADGKVVKRKDIVATKPWFWRDEVEENFEALMTKYGAPAKVAYERIMEAA